MTIVVISVPIKFPADSQKQECNVGSLQSFHSTIWDPHGWIFSLQVSLPILQSYGLSCLGFFETSEATFWLWLGKTGLPWAQADGALA